MIPNYVYYKTCRSPGGKETPLLWRVSLPCCGPLIRLACVGFNEPFVESMSLHEFHEKIACGSIVPEGSK
jgi:hypothetical protein